MAPTFLLDGPAAACITVLLAHGAGAPMDSASMTAAATALAGAASGSHASNSATWRPGALASAGRRRGPRP